VQAMISDGEVLNEHFSSENGQNCKNSSLSDIQVSEEFKFGSENLQWNFCIYKNVIGKNLVRKFKLLDAKYFFMG
jgi:hypothetical protein